MMNKPRILVTSAAGRTGSVAVLELLRKGFPVRAFVRRNDARSEVTGQRDGVQDARLDVAGPPSGETDRPWSCHDGLRLKWGKS